MTLTDEQRNNWMQTVLVAQADHRETNDVPTADDEPEVEPVDDISNLRYRKGLWETRGGLFD